MREIKFRLIKDGKIIGYEIHRQSKHFHNVFCEYSEDNYIWSTSRIRHDDKEQYSGLKDKNGTEIYEGDIVAIYPVDRKAYGEKSVWKIITELDSWGCQFGWEHISGYDCSTHIMEDDPINYEVIGNIHEGKEGE